MIQDVSPQGNGNYGNKKRGSALSVTQPNT